MMSSTFGSSLVRGRHWNGPRVAYHAGPKEPRTMPARYRADQVGSFLRPPDLLEARARGRRRPGAPAGAGGPAHPARPRPAEGARLRGLHRRRAAPAELHERLHGRRRGLRHGRRGGALLAGRAGQGRRGEQRRRHRDRQAAAGPPPHRARAAVPEGPQPGRDQDDAAERHPVPGHRLQARDVTDARLPRPLGAALGHRRDHEGGAGRALRRRRRATSRSTPRATATSWTRSGATGSGRR